MLMCFLSRDNKPYSLFYCPPLPPLRAHLLSTLNVKPKIAFIHFKIFAGPQQMAKGSQAPSGKAPRLYPVINS